jgi:transcriptional regulator with XRE-family HTH domain
MDWASSLLKIRENLGWTQEELAKNLGITQAFASQLEKGTRSPSVKLRVKIYDLADQMAAKEISGLKERGFGNFIFNELFPKMFQKENAEFFQAISTSVSKCADELSKHNLGKEVNSIIADSWKSLISHFEIELADKDELIAELKSENPDLRARNDMLQDELIALQKSVIGFQKEWIEKSKDYFVDESSITFPKKSDKKSQPSKKTSRS